MIKISNLSKSFGEKTLFKGFSLDIDDKEFVIIAGESGCGKTTLLNMIGAIEPFDEGEITVDGMDISKRKNRQAYLQTGVGFLFQNFALVENKTVKQNFKLIKKGTRSNVSVEEAMDFVGMPMSVLNRKVYTLSGGEQQRIALARLMLKKCGLILADEPTGSLDRKNSDIVFDILQKLREQGKTVVVVSHDESIQSKGDRVIRI